MKTKSLIILIAIAAIVQITLAELPRRAFIGTQLLEVCDSIAELYNVLEKEGVYVQLVVEGSTAESIGVQPGDIILKANDFKAVSVSGFIDFIQQHGEGDPLDLEVLRDGEHIRLFGTMSGFPRETSPHAEVIYDQFAFDGGYVRTIIHRPEEPGVYPVLFFIQGYTCGSMDNMRDLSPVRKLLESISERGFVVVKTEKAGVGDSRSHTPCSDMDLFTEVELFEASFNALKKYDFIDHDNVFVFGHSMGGVQAPLMHTDFDPRGIIVYGTVARPWFEYLIEQTRMQRLILGQDYLVNEANHEQSIHFYYRFLIQKETLEELMQDPEMAEFLARYWRFEDGGYLNGRHYTFWQQLQDTEPFKAWSQTNAHVLSLHGEGEYIAFNPYEHELIADIVNHYNPGRAQFVSVPNIDHAFLYVNDREHSAAVRSDGAYWRHNFNHGIVNLVVNWMQEVMNN
jgi:uncharacterized protein